MKIRGTNVHESITYHARRGRVTLELGDLCLATDQEVEIPDHWAYCLYANLPVTGRNNGFLTLSQAGYDENRDDLERAFQQAIYEGTSEGDCIAYYRLAVEQHFNRVAKATINAIRYHVGKRELLMSFHP